MAQSESDLAKRVVKWLNDQPGVWARKKHGTPYGFAGDPDVYGCANGRFFGIELKIWPNKPTKLQEKRLEEIAAAGGITGVAWSLDDVKNIMRPYIETDSQYESSRHHDGSLTPHDSDGRVRIRIRV